MQGLEGRREQLWPYDLFHNPQLLLCAFVDFRNSDTDTGSFPVYKVTESHRGYLVHTSFGKPGAFDKDAAGPILSFV